MACSFFTFVALALMAVTSFACESPEVTSDVYTTTDALLTKESVLIVELGVQCKNVVPELNLYADVMGSLVPATKIPGEEKFQVTVTDTHKALAAGTYAVHVYDDEGATQYRKAQRAGEPTAAVKALFTVDVEHKGASGTLNINSEFCAAAIAVLVWYLAYSARCKMIE